MTFLISSISRSLISIYLALALLSQHCQPTTANRLNEPSELPTFGVEFGNFTGTWYNVEANFFVKAVIYRFGSCAVAKCRYSNVIVSFVLFCMMSISSRYMMSSFAIFADDLLENGSLSVLNTGKGPFGGATSIEGVAIPTADPGKLFLTQGEMEGQYWIVGIGAINDDGQYSYAIISDESSFTLFVLVRSVDQYEQVYRDEIAEKVEGLGFTGFLGRPRPIDQSNCDY